MKIPQSKTARAAKVLEHHGVRLRVEVARTTGLNDGSLTSAAKAHHTIMKRDRLPAGSIYDSSLTFCNNKAVAIFDEVTITPLDGKWPSGPFDVDLKGVFPDIPAESAPSVGRVQAPVVLDFAAVMPAPIVNVAPGAAPRVDITNDVRIPQIQKLSIERDDTGKITGATISRNGSTQ